MDLLRCWAGGAFGPAGFFTGDLLLAVLILLSASDSVSVAFATTCLLRRALDDLVCLRVTTLGFGPSPSLSDWAGFA